MAALRNIRPRIFTRSPWAAKTILAGFIAAPAILATASVGGNSAHAQVNCDARKSLLAKLDTGYDEQPVASGVASSGNLVELLISSGGTWTILITNPNGITCIAAVGEDWQDVKPKIPGEAS
jgi:hypothetical protein